LQLKTIILSFLLLCQISLFALDKDINNSIEYKNALTAFNKKDYEKSFSLFDKLIKSHPENELIIFYYGRSSFELNNYEFAFAAFDKLLIKNPMNHRARLEYGRTLLMLEAYKEAQEEFKKVLASPIPASVRKNVEKFLKVIEKANKQYVLNQILIFSFGWDDNINNNTYEDITIVDTLPLTNDTDKEKDTHFKLTLINNFIKPFKNKQYTFESTSVVYIQQQNKYSEDHIQLISLSNGIGYTGKNFKQLFSLTYDHIWLESDENMYIYGIVSDTTFRVLEKDLLKFRLKYKNKNMTETIDEEKDSKLTSLNILYTHQLNEKDRLMLDSNFSREKKKQGTRTDISKKTYLYSLAYQRYFEHDLDLRVSYTFEKKRFDDKSYGLPKRVDKQHKTSLKLSKKLDKSHIVFVETSNIKTDSTINTYNYKKNTASINYMVIF